MCFLSRACFTHPKLLALFDRLPQQIGTCELTHQTNIMVIDGTQDEAFMPVRALARYYINEWEYNGHFGGDDNLGKLLVDKNLLYNFKLVDPEAFEEYMETVVFSEAYYDYDKGVSMYAGYYEGQQNPLLGAIGNVTTRLIARINNELHDRNLSKLLQTVKEIVDSSLPRTQLEINDLTLFRARIGYKDRKVVNDFDFSPPVHYFPFVKEEIGPPPVKNSNKGRMNREGFSFLYLAEDAETAIAEVRAVPGDIVSIGRFKQKISLTIADFSEIVIEKFWMNDTELDLFEKLHSIAKFISNPVGTGDGYVYVLTQLIAEELLRQGINGICFTSSLTGKKNYTIFNSGDFKYDKSEAFVCKIDQIQTHFTYLKVGDDKTEYMNFR